MRKNDPPTTNVTVHLTDAQIAALDEIADRKSKAQSVLVSRTAVIRAMVERGISEANRKAGK